MPQGKTGVTADTTKRRLLGEGALWINYGLGAPAGERLLGAVTQGEFDPGITLAQGDIAGAIGILKGMDYIESCIPTLQATLLEITTENLVNMLPGGSPGVLTTRARQEAEWLGLGDGGETVFPLEQDNVYSGTLRIWRDVGFGPVLLAEGVAADWTADYAAGEVTFNTAPPAAVAGTSRSGLAPVTDMTAFPTQVNGIVAVDGGAPTAVVYAWAACTTGDLVAAQMQIAIRALAGDFATVTCVYVGTPPNDYYLITSSLAGATSQFVCSDGAPENAHDQLKLGLANGGTEVFGGDAANLTSDYVYDPQDGAETHDVVTANPIDEALDYLTNIAWLGRTTDNAAEDLIIVIHNPIATEMAAWTLEEKGNIGVQVTFSGRVTGAAPQVLPFEVRRPKAA